MNHDELLKGMELVFDKLSEQEILKAQQALLGACKALDLSKVKTILQFPMMLEHQKELIEELVVNYYRPINPKSKKYSAQVQIINTLITSSANYKHILLNRATDLNTMQLLLDAGASPYNLNDAKMNLLHACALLPANYEEKMRHCLHTLNIDVNCQDMSEFANTPLQGMIANENIEQALFFTDEVMKLPLERQFNLNLQDREGKTSLLLACKIRSLALVEKLLPFANKQSGSDLAINIPDNKGRTALHIACLLGCFEIVQLLLTNGANPTSKDNKGKTPLDYCQAEKQAIKHCLNEIDIDDQRAENAQSNYLSASKYRQVIILPSQNFSELQIPANKSSKAIVDNAIKELKKTQSPARKAELSQILVSQKSQPHVIDAICSQSYLYLQKQFTQLSGRTVLEACLAGHKTCQEILLSFSPANLMQESKNTRDFLSEALYNKDERAIIQFFQNNPNINIDSATLNKKNKRTALHRAACEGDLDLLKLLIKVGAELNVSDKQGDNALHIAIKNVKFSTALYLLAQGVDPQLVNKAKKRPVDLILACVIPKNFEEREAYEQLKKNLFSNTDESLREIKHPVYTEISLTSTHASPVFSQQKPSISFTMQEEPVKLASTEEMTSGVNVSANEDTYIFSPVPLVIDKPNALLPDITNKSFATATSIQLSTEGSNIPSAFFKTVPPGGIMNSLIFDTIVTQRANADTSFSIKINLDKLQKKTEQHYGEIVLLIQAVLQEKGINSNYYKHHKSISDSKGGYIHEITFIEEEAATRLLKRLHRCLVKGDPLLQKIQINKQPSANGMDLAL